jgi:NAD(P)-dependent dehydrogenase (short-subunit alcohol dehydrogenase family)
MSVILIAGSNSEIGIATALHLAEKNHRVYARSRRDLNRGNDLQTATDAKNSSIEAIRLDVNDETSHICRN